MKCMRVEPRKGPQAGEPWLQTSGSCLNGGHVDGLCRFVVSPLDLDFLAGKVGWFLLIVEFVNDIFFVASYRTYFPPILTQFSVHIFLAIGAFGSISPWPSFFSIIACEAFLVHWLSMISPLKV
jgi:hypothetical protein